MKSDRINCPIKDSIESRVLFSCFGVLDVSHEMIGLITWVFFQDGV